MSDATDDRELVRRCCEGDVTAFEAIYRRHGDKVFGIACRLTLDVAQAEDLTQEAFVQIWQRIASFRGESALSTWMYRVATNVVLAELRKGRGLRLVSDSEASVPEIADPGGVEVGVEIESQLKRLPERARMILVMHDLAGMTHEEIGDELSIAAGTSKAQLFRARALYREGEEGSNG